MTHNQTKRWFPIPQFQQHLQTVGLRRGRRQNRELLPRPRLSRRRGRPTGDPDRLKIPTDGKSRWVALNIPITEGPRYRLGELTVEGNTSVQPSLSALAVQNSQRRGLQREGDSRGPEQGTGALRRTRAASNSRRIRICSRTRSESEVHRRCDASRSGRAEVSHQPHHVRRQHHDARSGDSPRAARVRRRRLQQRSAENEHPPPESAWLFQAARGSEKHPGREDTERNRKSRPRRSSWKNRTGTRSVSAPACRRPTACSSTRSYATTNFLGKGETLSLNIETGSRSNNYQASLTEPYVFDRPISLGASLFSRKTQYFLISSDPEYSEVREGASLTAGMPLRSFSRLFNSYTYEIVDSASSEALQHRARQPPASSATADTDVDGDHHDRKRHDDLHPYHTFRPDVQLPDRGRTPCREPCRTDVRVRHRRQPVHAAPRHAYHRRVAISGRISGGSVNYLRPEVEWIVYIPHTRRTAVGLRGQADICVRTAAPRRFPTTCAISSAARTRFAASIFAPLARSTKTTS